MAILIAAGFGMLATFLPWVKVPFIGSINGTQRDGYGWVTFVLYLIPFIICLVGKQSEPLKGIKHAVALVPSFCASIIGFVKIYEFNSKMNLINSDNPFAKALTESVSIEVGLYLVALAGIVLQIVVFFIDQTARNRMAQKSSPPKPNDKIKLKIESLHDKATGLLVFQGIIYLAQIMNTGTGHMKFDTVESYLIFSIFLLVAIIHLIRAYFMRRKLNDDKENENVDILSVKNLTNVSPAPNPNTSHTNSHTEKISKLKELKELLDAGILNQQEYDNEKAKILS